MAQKPPAKLNGYFVCPHDNAGMQAESPQPRKLTSRQRQVFDVLVRYIDRAQLSALLLTAAVMMWTLGRLISLLSTTGQTFTI